MEPENQEKEVQSDVEAMNKSFDDIVVGEPEPEPKAPPEVPGEGESVPQAELEDEPEAQPQGDEELEPEPSPDPRSEEAPPEPVLPEPIEDKDQIISELRTKLAEKEVAPVPEPEPEPEPVPEPLTIEDQDFLGDTDPEELVRDPAEFNKLLNKVFHQGIDTARKVLGEGVLRSIPDIVKANVVAMANLKEASEKFYTDNKDLEPFKEVVAAVFEIVSSENPGKSYSEILPKVGEETRKRLALHKKAVEGAGGKPPAPRLPRKKGRSTPPENKPSTDPLLDELDSMNKSLGGN